MMTHVCCLQMTEAASSSADPYARFRLYLVTDDKYAQVPIPKPAPVHVT
jgi:hypothetical protein